MVRFSDVTAAYEGADNPVFSHLTFQVPMHGFLYLTGNSGVGKTTVLRLLMRELKPQSGEIFVNGQEIGRLKKRQIPLYRRQIGLVSQSIDLLEDKTVYENVELVKLALGAGKNDIRIQVAMALKFVGMDSFFSRYPGELSGGQRKKVCIARAIVNQPDLILADEPTANLDSDGSLEVMNLFAQLHRRGSTVIVATHDLAAIRPFDYPRLELYDNGTEDGKHN